MCRQHLWHWVYLGLDELSFMKARSWLRINLDRMVSRGQYGMCRQHLWHWVYLGLDELSFNESLILAQDERWRHA